MTDLRTAAQQALEALEMSRRFVYADNRPQCDEAIAALRAALAQQDEPVAWMESSHGAIKTNPNYKFTFPSQLLHWQIPLYTAPPQRKPVVSVDELANHIRVVDGNHSLGAGALAEKIVEFLIERAHGIGEQP